MFFSSLASTAAAVVAAASLFGTAQANFDVYRTEVYSGNRPAITWQFWEAEAPKDCGAILRNAMYEELNNKGPFWDVFWGVHCTGSGCDDLNPPGDIDQLRLKLRANPLLDWTLRKDQGWSMIGRDGNAYGNCIVFPQGDFECKLATGWNHIATRRKFRCLTRFTANDLNGVGRKRGDDGSDVQPPMTLEQYIEKEFGKSPATNLVSRSFQA
ncbi:hypothetical protein Micbo1qcDRAFT_209099 [Microdochium bolleyi]|uniref:Ecp2 effector protein domain-containing protein n=1 Tax=Microdochium bolleyi TaxID=196109 RepID=A0A136IN87_9PEZI|nr:hypothetical protein Micbo1qcDRAFT_209099 [Microdochium bolleyi]